MRLLCLVFIVLAEKAEGMKEGMNDVQKLTKNQIHQIRAKRKCGNIRVKFPLITIFDNFKRKSSQEEIVMLDQTYRS